MRLYSFFRSSAAYRVRIALALKGLPYDLVPVNLLRKGGDQNQPEYRAKNPAGLVPALELDDGAVLGQSLAIMEYLEETHPLPALLPADPLARAHVRGLALAAACDIHPLNNLRVLKYLKRDLDIDDQGRDDWYKHWVDLGLSGIEAIAAASPLARDFCAGNAPGLAECCLIPQMQNGRNLGMDMSVYPFLSAVEARCLAMPQFQAAHPDNQPDKA